MRLWIRASSTNSSTGALSVAVGRDRRRADSSSPLLGFLHNLARSRSALTGGVILVALIAVTLLAPVIARYDPIEQDYGIVLTPPSPSHPFGTDNFGRDVLSRVLFGTRFALQIGLASVAVGLLAGAAIGIVSGYYGKFIDAVLMRSIDVMMSFPGILLALAIVSLLGNGMTNVIIAIGIGSIPGFARMVRGSVLVAREEDYVTAARVVGCHDRRIMLRYLLPNIATPLIVYSTLRVAGAILAGASLNFLGLGVQPPTPDWGLMLSSGREFLQRAWWIATFPGLAIMITTIGINIFGDGLRDVLDPRTVRSMHSASSMKE